MNAWDTLKQAGLVSPPQTTGIDRDQNVSRAVGALALYPLDQSVALALDAVDLDSGGLREIAVERLVRLVVAR